MILKINYLLSLYSTCRDFGLYRTTTHPPVPLSCESRQVLPLFTTGNSHSPKCALQFKFGCPNWVCVEFTLL